VGQKTRPHQHRFAGKTHLNEGYCSVVKLISQPRPLNSANKTLEKMLTKKCDYGHLTMLIIKKRGAEKVEKAISKSQFKPRSLEYFRMIEESGEELIITDRGRPVLKVIPYTVDPEERMKSLRNSVLQYDDPTEPAAAEDWKALQ
jgi:antitoxin (DNA-binding transcriptional repressor) of toxin-antitoxin stability system